MTAKASAAVFASTLALALCAPCTSDATHQRVLGYGQIAFDGHGPEWWAQRSRGWHRQLLDARTQLHAVQRTVLRVRRVLLAKPSVGEAIDLACATYGYCSTLWRKARCESGLRSYAQNGSGASGLFQFLPSTFASTPYRSMSIWSPYANAMAAGWMHEHGRGGEWVCQ